MNSIHLTNSCSIFYFIHVVWSVPQAVFIACLSSPGQNMEIGTSSWGFPCSLSASQALINPSSLSWDEGWTRSIPFPGEVLKCSYNWNPGMKHFIYNKQRGLTGGILDEELRLQIWRHLLALSHSAFPSQSFCLWNRITLLNVSLLDVWGSGNVIPAEACFVHEHYECLHTPHADLSSSLLALSLFPRSACIWEVLDMSWEAGASQPPMVAVRFANRCSPHRRQWQCLNKKWTLCKPNISSCCIKHWKMTKLFFFLPLF